jgi:hypothetical protein
MGICASCQCTPKRRQPHIKSLERQRTIDKNHDFGYVYVDVVSDYRERQPSAEEILTFYSMDPTDPFISELTDATPSTTVPGDNSVPHEPANRPRRMLKCGRTGEFYGYRDRIPSHIELDSHPDDYWWSNANLGRPAIAKDMGEDMIVISRAIKVTVVPSSYFASHRDLEVFPEYMGLCREVGVSPPPSSSLNPQPSSSMSRPPAQSLRLIIFKLKMGDQIMVSLNEVINEKEFDRLFREENRDELLMRQFKFILSPINSPLPIPAKKPRDAETVGQYFGMDNVDMYIDERDPNIKVVSILINIYSKWIIRKFLPVATSALGRICDFILLSSDEKVVYADFRLLSTEVSRSLIRGT